MTSLPNNPKAEHGDRLEKYWECLNKLPDLSHAHYVEICVRINGEDKHFEGDWLKRMQVEVNEA